MGFCHFHYLQKIGCILASFCLKTQTLCQMKYFVHNPLLVMSVFGITHEKELKSVFENFIFLQGLWKSTQRVKNLPQLSIQKVLELDMKRESNRYIKYLGNRHS